MPRYVANSLAATDPDFRKANNIGGGGGNSSYLYGKQNNILIASGNDLFANGLCLRFLPIYGDEPPVGQPKQFVKFREGPDRASLGDWCRQMTCAHWVGNPGVCFIIHDGNPNLNLYDSPYHVLRNVAWNNSSATKKGSPHPTLGRVFDDLLSKEFVKASSRGSLKKPEEILFVSASVVYKDESGRIVLGAFTDDQKKNARIIGLKTSAAESLYSAISVTDENTGEYLCGDMLSIGAASLLTLLPETFQGDGRNRQAFSIDGPAGVKLPPYAQQKGPVIVGHPRSPSSFTHFGVIHQTYGGQLVSLEAHADQLAAETLSWDEYLKVLSYIEQAELLATRFPREVLDFAWREYPEYLRCIPTGASTFVGVTPNDADLLPEAPPAPAVQRQVQSAAPVAPRAPAGYVDPPAPWDGGSDELAPEDAAGVEQLFTADVPPPPPAPAANQAVGPKGNSPADILARARARAAANNR